MSGNGAPKIRTERLTLRLPVIQDFEVYSKFMASPRSVGMGGPFDTRFSWGLFCHDLAQWQLFGHGALMIDLNETGVCVGQVGINHGPLFPEKQLGWHLYDGHEGGGYATEAAFGLRGWAFGTLGLPTLVSYIEPNNFASIAVALRLGGILDPSAPRSEPGDLVYRYFAR